LGFKTLAAEWGEAEPIDDGNGFAVWVRTEAGTSNGNIWANRCTPGSDRAARLAGGDWSVPDRIDHHEGGNKSAPDITVDEARHAHAIWLHSESNTDKLRTNRFE